MDEDYSIGFNVEGQDFGLDPHGHSKGMTGPVAYWHVDDIEQRLQALLDAGAEAHQGVRDVGGGKLLASVKDTDGNVIGLIQAPWLRGYWEHLKYSAQCATRSPQAPELENSKDQTT